MDSLLYARDDCISCPSQAPSCACGVDQQCIQTGRNCTVCPSVTCVPQVDDTATASKGVSAGAIAGGVIAAVVIVVVIVGLIFWYRHKRRAGGPAATHVDAKPDVPARAEAVLRRPDPVEKPASPPPPPGLERNASSYRMYTTDDATINLDPDAYMYPTEARSRTSAHSDPFRDRDAQSIRTTSASTQSTNVIPIALVPHGTVSNSPQSGSSEFSGNAPSRPARDPLSTPLNLEHVNVSYDSFRPPHVLYEGSTASGATGVSKRESVLTTGSFASDVLYEAPQILTTTTSARPVLGVAKPEVISLPPGSAPLSPNSLRPTVASRGGKQIAAGRSPLAQSSFGPGDTLTDTDSDTQEIVYHTHNPFADENVSERGSVSTFGFAPSPMPLPSTASPQHSTYMDVERAKKSPVPVRPTSTFTQAGSIIDAEIAGATLVRMGSVKSANSERSAAPSEYRLTSAHLVTPMRRDADRTLQEQQAHALAAARARAAASGLPPPGLNRRTSAASDASAGGDSLLESFTFVPPSPISSLPPRSPLSATSGMTTRMQETTPPTSIESQVQLKAGSTAAGRMSTASGTSALEGYTFHIEPTMASPMPSPAQRPPMPPMPEELPATKTHRPPPNSMNNNRGGKQRASLDTLALTADLSAFPLNFGDVPRA